MLAFEIESPITDLTRRKIPFGVFPKSKERQEHLVCSLSRDEVLHLRQELERTLERGEKAQLVTIRNGDNCTIEVIPLLNDEPCREGVILDV